MSTSFVLVYEMYVVVVVVVVCVWGGGGGVGVRGCSEMMYSPTCIKQALRNKQVLALFKTDAYLIQVQFNVIAFFMDESVLA